jgi:GAF domain-containing protein
VILAFRQALREVSGQRCPEVAGEFLCDLFDGSAAALNLMDYGHSRYHTVTNVGQLATGERRVPDAEYYAFADFPFTTQHLARGGSYRSALEDPDCPAEYRELLTATRRTDCLGAPIRVAGRPVGEFWVARNTGRPFSEADEDLAVACGATLARFFGPSWAVAG